MAAVLSFYWWSQAGAVELESLPLCKDAWETIGRRILANNATASSIVRSNVQCSGIPASTPPPSATLIGPGDRNWCSNHNPEAEHAGM